MINLDNNADLPLYMQIYDQLKQEIINGILPEGSRLPSTRHLAQTLEVGRNTVEYAYLQLSSEGYVVSRVGSGFIVQNLNGLTCLTYEENGNKPVRSSKPESSSSDIYPYNFQYGHLSAQDFPLNIWRKMSKKALTTLTAEDLTAYCDKKGELELRCDLSDYLRKSRGVSCSAEQIILCSGLEYALSLLCQLLRDKTTQIALEEPGYIGAKNIFTNNGFQVSPIRIEKDGLNTYELENSSAGAVYVTPSHQFPTGVVTSIQKRQLLLDWAKRKNGLIIEDDYDSELRYNCRPIPSIISIAGNENVVYIGTFSKALSPSLRVSYMVLPQKLLDLHHKKFKMYQTPVSLLEQRIIQELIRSRYWENHLRKTCVVYKKKHDLLIRSISEAMGNIVKIHGKNAGLHILLESSQGLTEKEMIERAKENGVLVLPVSTFWSNPDNYSNNMVLLGFGNLSENDIIQGIKKLAQAWGA
ncbi:MULTISPECIES: MocR-like pyridoxine biosynthesis transcription factor PdxR [Paenibacillus]|uniref:GntR family transcriptional regulator n=1 Tax=Paenibacillus durus ATCC 35681 TaxID=1333534 RepID=A0A0F7FAT1_PAEDU|nr:MULTISPECIES: PLP-dependent aminotransferase family protein [Paenibacillus]AKG35818.1 GntR family transcriptional regulator [Paenibacillus durus ATCC 35681]